MSFPKDIKFTDDHEWIKIDDNIVTVGITDFAQSELGDIIYVEFPDVGTKFSNKDSIGTLEAVKTVADIFAPLSGFITEINESLEDNPELINESPYENGWIIKMKIEDIEDYGKLLNADEYKKLIK
jgi:glycine cleavage system H protein